MKRAISFAFILFSIFSFTQIKAQQVQQSDIKPINNSISLISQLQPVSFNYDKNWVDKLKLSSASQYGFVAEDLKKVIPSAVSLRAKDYPAGKNAFKTATIPTVDLESLVPLLVGSIKEQQQQIEELKREIQELKTQKAE